MLEGIGNTTDRVRHSRVYIKCDDTVYGRAGVSMEYIRLRYSSVASQATVAVRGVCWIVGVERNGVAVVAYLCIWTGRRHSLCMDWVRFHWLEYYREKVSIHDDGKCSEAYIWLY